MHRTYTTLNLVKTMLIFFKKLILCLLPICFVHLSSTFYLFYSFSQHISAPVECTTLYIPPHLRYLRMSLSFSLSIHLFSIMFLSLTPCWESDTQTQTPSLLPTFVSFLLPSDLLSGSRLPCAFSLCFSHTSSSRLFSPLSSPVFRSITLSLLLLWPFSVQSCISCSFSPSKSFLFPRFFLLFILSVHFFVSCRIFHLLPPSFFSLSFCVRPLREFALRVYFGLRSR